MFQSHSNRHGTVAREEYIGAMRGVASSVTVVTTDGPAGRHGATVSAFSSVSADPPTMLVCLRGGSRIAEAVARNGAFCINVLPQSQDAIADRFAGRHDADVPDRFEGIDCHGASGTGPVLKDATAFSCRTEQTVASGSHIIVIGHVVRIETGAPDPLAYLDGAYHRVAPHNAVSFTPRTDAA